MFAKPFKPPLRRAPPDPSTLSTDVSSEPASKRRRISDEEYTGNDGLQSKHKSTSHEVVTRMPLDLVENPPSPERTQKKDGFDDANCEGYYMVLWRKFSTKKHKTWDSDGVLTMRGGIATLFNIDGSDIGGKKFSQPLLPGSQLSIGGMEVEIDSIISKQDYLAGRPFTGKRVPSQAFKAAPIAAKVSNTGQIATGAPQKAPLSLQARLKAEMVRKASLEHLSTAPISSSKSTKSTFRNPLKDNIGVPRTPIEKALPMWDPDAPGALVFKRPMEAPKGRQIVDVVLDPLLGKQLREHQKEGIKFLYECVMGLREFDGQGCILADDMGLGKTLQTIALLWTLLKQNPVHGVGPVIKKALIVCPVTLIDNWRKEFRKWLGNDRIGVFVVDGPKTKLTDFTMGKIYNVMIIGYERLKSVAEELTKGSGVDIVIADEGHRLKTVQNKSAKAIQSLNTLRRVILSGTPIQNDLSEFFSMVNFVNDGCLGNYKSFMKTFETPIVKSRQPNALEKDIELGEARGAELAETTSPFILRRTADILSKYLPSKTEYVLFCNPTPDQANAYRHVLATPMFSHANPESALQLITILKKLCNSPYLLRSKTEDDDISTSTSLSALVEMLPTGLVKTFRNQASTKIRILDQLLHEIRSTTDEKVVLISNYTSTMDILAQLLTANGLPHLRLDGSTPASKRQSLVDDFNRSPAKSCFAFLLSAKAGGLGLNLIGGSRLILFDVDWNPATDDQAMARIHREGQKRHCKIYRFLVKGGLEERIWQRQVVKRGLAESIMDGGNGASNSGGGSGGKKGTAAFSREELKDLFRLDQSEMLRTHELIGCPCGGRGTTTAEDVFSEGRDAGKSMSIDSSKVSDTDDESLPDVTTLMKMSAHSAASMKRQERKIASAHLRAQTDSKSGRNEEMQALMEYSHLDTSRFSALEEDTEELERVEAVVDDDCLMQVLLQDREAVAGGVAYLFTKTSASKVEQRDGGDDIIIKKEEVKSNFFNHLIESIKRPHIEKRSDSQTV